MKWILFALVAFGCGDKKQAAAARPAVVTQEMADTFEAYVVQFEKLTGDIEHAGADCKAALDVVQRDGKEVAALAPRGDRLREAMQAAKGDTAASEWFATTYAVRMKASAMKLAPLENNCAKDTELHAALGDVMGQFPMMRKKK